MSAPRLAWPLLPFETAATIAFVALTAIELSYGPIANATWILGGLAWLLLWFVGIVLAGGGIMLALASASERPLHRWRGALAMPLALAASAWLQRPAFDWGARLHAEWALRRDPSLMQAAAARPARPQLFTLVEGIPDGGSAIVYKPGPPPSMTALARQIAGRMISRCDRLRAAWYLCSLD